jgi:CHAD domain-containing protein
MPLGAAAVAVLRFHYARMETFEPVARHGADPEGVHHTRTSVRRMRAMLRLSGSVFPPKPAKRLRRDLRRAGRVLGDVRDLDVFRDRARTWQVQSSVAAPGLAAAWDHRHAEARAELLAYLDGHHRRQLAASLTAITDSGTSGPAVLTVLPALIADLTAKMYGLGRAALAPDPSLEELHRLRIAAKRLRYLLEGFFAVVDRQAALPVLVELKSLQDYLGTLQDAVVARHLLLGYLATGELRVHDGGTEPRAAPGAAAYLMAVEEAISTLVAGVPAVWRRLDDPSFRRLIAGTTGMAH